MKKILSLLLVLISITAWINGQVKIGGTGAPESHAVLELDGGSDKGLLLPRLTDAQMNAMSTPPSGLLIFNTTDGFMYYHHDGSWQKVSNTESNTGVTLPYEETLNLSGGYMFNLTNTGTTGGALLGIGTDAATGVVGYSENGNGVVGNSTSGLGGYFSSISGTAVYADGKIGINTINSPASLGFTDDVGNKISMGENPANHFGIGLQPGVMQMYTDQATSDIAMGSGCSTNFNEVMRIKGNGNIGIGNASPEAPLSFSNANGNKILLQGNAGSALGMGAQNNLMQFYTTGSTADMAFGHGSSNSFTENIRFKGNGKIGIGTTDPAYPVTLAKEGLGFVQKGNTVEVGMETKTNAGMIKTVTNHSLWFGTNNSAAPQMAINLNGQVGIGTHLPSTTLDVVDNDPNILKLTNSSPLADGQETKALFKNGAYYTGMIATEGSSSSEADLKIYTGAGLIPGSLNPQMVITNEGNVGLGVEDPLFSLDVDGAGRFKHEGDYNYALDVTGSMIFSGDYDVTPVFQAYGSPGQTSIYLDHPVFDGGYNFLFVQLVKGYQGTYGVRWDSYAQKFEIYVINPDYIDSIITYDFQLCNGDCKVLPVPTWKSDDFSDAVFNVMVMKRRL